jgi:hypothetical protein
MVTKGGQPEMWFFDLDSNAWSKGTCKGTWQPSRWSCYIPDQDVIFQITQAIKNDSTVVPSVFQVYRCATNEWIQPDIAFPSKGRRPASWDTGLTYDPVHKALVLIDGMGFNAPVTTFLLRYDDKNAKITSAP